MANPRKGTIQRFANGKLRVRISVTTKSGKPYRPWIEVPGHLSDDEARSYAYRASEAAKDKEVDPDEVKRLRSSQHVGYSVRSFVDAVYLPSRKHLAAAHYEPGWWRIHILPILGDEDVRTFGPAPLRDLVDYLDDRVEDSSVRFKWKTAVSVWGLVTKFCADLQKSKDARIRLREDNPSIAVTGPDRGLRVDLQWLYPTELQALLASEKTPLEFARFVGAQTYLFCRPGEALGLDWEHSIDLTHRMVRIDCALDERTGKRRPFTKTGDVRVFPIPDVLFPMLTAMRREQGGKGHLFGRAKKRPTYLRRYLADAGVVRGELHTDTPNSKSIRLHDLRATGISYLAMAGFSDDDIRERAGHEDFETTRLYIRRGKRVAEAVGDPFAPLPGRLIGKLSTPAVSPKLSTELSTPSTASRDSVVIPNTYKAPAVGLEPNNASPSNANSGVFDAAPCRMVAISGAAEPQIDSSVDSCLEAIELALATAESGDEQLAWPRALDALGRARELLLALRPSSEQEADSA